MGKYICDVTFTSHKGFFYRTSNRGERGVNWARNPTLSQEVRECRHGIGVARSVLLKIHPDEGIKARIYYFSKSEQRYIPKGTFRIGLEKAMGWAKANDYYLTKGGKEVLVIPVVLWEVVKEGEKPKVDPQRKLF